jgi:hypothetical protein
MRACCMAPLLETFLLIHSQQAASRSALKANYRVLHESRSIVLMSFNSRAWQQLTGFPIGFKYQDLNSFAQIWSGVNNRDLL